MKDRELLELAAKAAGIEGVISVDHKFIWTKNATERWNPLQDDGDALRLAVKLRIDVQFCKNMGGEFVEVMAHPVGRGDCMGMAEIGEDDLAATRRAIVRAAAEIGKEQQ